MHATSSDSFDSNDVTVNSGDTVTWVNDGGQHNVVFDDGLFTQPATPMFPAGWPAVVSRTFSMVGTFSYYCAKHQALGMTGVVKVGAASSPPPPGGSPPRPGGSPPPGRSPAHETATLAVSDSTPKRGRRVRFFGSVRPQYDGATVQIQRRTRHGKYKTVATARLKHAGASRSRFSISLRISSDGVFRVRIPGDRSHATATSRTRRLKVH